MRWWVYLLLVATSACGRQEPAFLSVLVPEDTFDTVGPYRIEAYVDTPTGVGRLLLRVETEEGSPLFSEKLLRPTNPESEAEAWYVELPGRPAGTHFAFYLLLADVGGALVRAPEEAPVELFDFRVLYPPAAAP